MYEASAYVGRRLNGRFGHRKDSNKIECTGIHTENKKRTQVVYGHTNAVEQPTVGTFGD